MSWERARRPEQKQQRRAAILDAAARLFDDEGLDGASLSAIARASRISKANLYRYFESREAILLEVLMVELDAWVADFGERLQALPAGPELEALADTVARSLASRPRTCGLLTALASVLEHNVSVELVADFKRTINAQLERALQTLMSVLPELSVEQASTFLMGLTLFATGVWPHANPSPVVQEVYARGLVDRPPMDFESTVREHAVVLLRGLTVSRYAGQHAGSSREECA